MTSRITNSMLSRTVLSDLQGSQNRLSRTYQTLSSGMRITRPSDDPYGAARAMDLRGELSQIAQFRRNVDDGQGWQETTDAALRGIADLVQRARTLLVGAGNDVGGQTAREPVAAELEQLIRSVKTTANTTYAGTYVFAGTSTTSKPYDVDGPDAYLGNGGSVVRTIAEGVDMKLNVDLAGRVLGNGTGSGDGKLLDTLRTIVAHLKGGTAADANALRTTDLAAMQQQLESLSAVRAEVGASVNRMSAAEERLQALEETVTGARSKVEEADAASTMVSYATQQAAYQASLKAGASIVQSSLIDFLR
ncbi:flagellar hook-associated protein FlgL [Patulibacter sp. SYSU D01012]|uniref:flagellar hook-associated protein FlgL n=1 Tax=Patulibacter sp. SYSU D01012 TaxID=2817381 RepID=UPI001B304F02|nr:flagellar hook-associated protein FlgL [Patulibacter sp. SYSU D01012]